MLEPENNPNPPSMVDPSPITRFLLARYLRRIASTKQIRKRNAKFEKKRLAEKLPAVPTPMR